MHRYLIAVVILLSVWLFVPVLAQASYYTPWKTVYRTVSARELNIWKAQAIAPHTRQNLSTWPRGQIALRERFRMVFNGREWDTNEVQTEMHGLFNLWGVECHAWYRYDWENVFTDMSNSCRSWGIGYAVETNQVTWNEGGNAWGFMMVGADFTLTVGIKGVPLQFGHWFRMPINTNGTLGVMVGG